MQLLFWKLGSSLSTSNNLTSLIHFLNLQKAHCALMVASKTTAWSKKQNKF